MKLIMLDIADIDEADVRLVQELFPLRYERAMRFIKREDRLLSCAAALLIHRALNIADESLVLRTAEGKPYLAGGPCFSIAHSFERCVLAVSESEIGVDIERLSERNLFASEAVLNEDELSWMRHSPLERFHVLWTRKESVYKAFGGVDDPKLIDALNDQNMNRFYIESVILDGYALSVCAKEAFGGSELMSIENLKPKSRA